MRTSHQAYRLAVRYYQLEDVIIVPIVEPEDKLVDVDLKVLCGDAMVDADDRSFEQAPEVFHTHCMDVFVDERLGMTDGFMLSATSGLGVALEFIGDKQFSTDANEGIEKRGERIGFEVLDDLGYYITASLLEPHDNLLAGNAPTTMAPTTEKTPTIVPGSDHPERLLTAPITDAVCTRSSIAIQLRAQD